MLTMTEGGLSPKQGTHGSFSLPLAGERQRGESFHTGQCIFGQTASPSPTLPRKRERERAA